MAKALLGSVGGPDPRLVGEVRRLRRRVSDLETQVVRLQAENDALHAELVQRELLTLDESAAVALRGARRSRS
jgi:hypothetical protein